MTHYCSPLPADREARVGTSVCCTCGHPMAQDKHGGWELWDGPGVLKPMVTNATRVRPSTDLERADYSHAMQVTGSDFDRAWNAQRNDEFKAAVDRLNATTNRDLERNACTSPALKALGEAFERQAARREPPTSSGNPYTLTPTHSATAASPGFLVSAAPIAERMVQAIESMFRSRKTV